jgi:hypothetical protein
MVAAALAAIASYRRRSEPVVPRVPLTRAEEIRQALFREIQPVKLSNCDLRRFGEPNDGGYLVCDNLLGAVQSGYSYGISGYDGWGCDISRSLRIPVHQYDCFNLTQPVCDGGTTIFHDECIGPVPGVQEGRPFDTLVNQIVKNGDAGKTLVVKMDVEGAEWNSFIQAPDEVFQRIDQLVVEFHGFDQDRFVEAMQKLRGLFHVAHLHWNNYSCAGGRAQFPAWAYEILFVNKRIGIVDPGGRVVLPHPLDTPNDPTSSDCQSAAADGKTGGP